MCHVPLSDPQFFRFLIHIDEALAAEAQAAGCPCGGVLHRANYPRKPRGCPPAFRAEYATRLSFCCSQCRRRTTSQSVRFLGRRVWLSWVVVLGSTRPAGHGTAAAALCEALSIPWRTLARWRRWWREDFVRTSLWRVLGARFLLPVAAARLPNGLLEQLPGQEHEPLRCLLALLTPLTITAPEGR
ncbi:hypothetical protein ECTOBSL9_2912 [Ectothiorhodospira sp. BSL-9]|nr:hypothetical protein ECTOBSL9_0719 [Ectothiorhodospira sp. BSL-9]ANB03646.1 hypothetical protein ECTOBSL9_0721 [Ectothiorhodospira sp. BSL-9]ANB03671.1 hypothetical protein ECTOBSL9_0956 [Ectothiorhodospira sp. BSL-9]ANB03867.1 hypothetical protein ECTOBSL9_2382 [Ectothiorhodospira sp. BSL-9]ANB03931.1 hypothetical protein ECTOBSL9_2912 [Ectothiorhodospira sp. BSL-9]